MYKRQSEAARELGISRQRFSLLRDRPGFPRPVGEIAAGQIWDLDEVSKWASSSLRGSAGRPVGGGARLLDGRYRLESQPLASGGFADVFRATDLTSPPSARSVVAVKVLRELDDEEVRRRFLRELRIVAQLSHPHIVPILDEGTDNTGHLWYAMPLAKGSLADEVERFVGDEEAILRVFRQICDGLAHVHETGIFHRDLKPGNVLRTAPTTWAVSDFGLAREAERQTTALTSTIQGVGTFFYAAPEAWSRARDADARSDIFSLGKVLLALSTGDLPHDGVEPPGRFRAVVEKATRREPRDRYQTVPAFLEALESAVSAPLRWRRTEEVAEELADRVRTQEVDPLALRELLELVSSAEDRREVVSTLRKTIPLLKRPSIEWLWTNDRMQFVDLINLYGRVVEEGSFDFGFCDVIADFFELVVAVADDDTVTAIAVRALVELGSSHNRWHVRDVVVGMLQHIRSLQRALAAREALQESRKESVRWTLGDFAIRSLHPTLRAAVTEIVGN